MRTRQAIRDAAETLFLRDGYARTRMKAMTQTPWKSHCCQSAGKRLRVRSGLRGVPLHRYALEDTSAAQAAVESGVIGEVLITVASR
jgi:hypothetical protein